MTFLKSPTSHYSKMISWAHDGEAMSPPVARGSVFAGFTVYRSPINSPLSFYIGFLPFASCWELDLAKPRDHRSSVKNYAPLHNTGALKPLAIQHRSSFVSDRTAVSRILGTLHRLRACVDTPAHRLRGAYELLVVYEAQGYPQRLFCDALRALGNKFKEPSWFAVSRLIRLARIP